MSLAFPPICFPGEFYDPWKYLEKRKDEDEDFNILNLTVPICYVAMESIYNLLTLGLFIYKQVDFAIFCQIMNLFSFTLYCFVL